MAMTGKSTIAHTVARAYFEQGRLAVFSRGGGDVGNASKFVTTTVTSEIGFTPKINVFKLNSRF
jgi:hypothetical protein